MAGTGITPSPDALVEANASVLARFGYRESAERDDWAQMWKLLKGDFATLARSRVPGFDELGPSQREAARIYMRRRLMADRFFEDCRAAQADLFNQGIDAELVERYALIREAYEEMVIDFGRARAKLHELLPNDR